jgi:CHASE2 domain-containing sensor protein
VAKPSGARRRRQRVWALFVCTLCASALVALFNMPLYAPSLLRLEHSTADWRTSLLSDRHPSAHPRIAIVTVSDDTLEPYPYNSPIDRGLLASLISELDKLAPKAIGLDFFYVKPTEPAKDAAYIAAVKAARAHVVMGALDERGRLKPAPALFQKEFLAEAGRPVGYLNLRIERDNVVRYRAGPAPASATPESFPALLAKAAGWTGTTPSQRIAWLRTPADEGPVFFTVRAEALLPGTPANIAARANGDLARLKDRVVLVGGDFPRRDQHITPFASWSAEQTAGVVLHAHMVAELIDNRSFTELGPGAARFLLLAIAVLGFLFGWSWRVGRVDLVAWTFATIVLIGVDVLVFSQWRVILPFTLALLAWFFSVTGGHAFGQLVTRPRLVRKEIAA